MPFAKRIVGEASHDEPTFKKIGDRTTGTCEVFFQNDAQIFFRQLESLVYQADDLFSELYTECSGLVERTRKVRDRVKALTEVVLRLNAKEVTVPEGNLSTAVESTDDHHRATYGYECQLFTPSTWPWCVERLHRECDVNPVHTIRQCNLFRIDGKTGSVIFSMNPTLATSCTSFEILQPQKTSIAQRTAKPLREPQCTGRQDSIAASTKVTDDCKSVTGDRIRLLSQSQPILLIPVDVSGATYRQISERRTRSQSQRSCESSWELGALTNRVPSKRYTRKRRGGSGSASSTIDSASSEKVTEEFGFSLRTCDDLWRRSPSKERWERARLLAQEQETESKPTRHKLRLLKQRSKTKKQDESSFCSWRKSLCSMFRPSKEEFNDLWIEGSPETREKIDRVDPLAFTRSQSLPRSFRSTDRKPQSKLVSSKSLTAVKASEPAIHPKVAQPCLNPSKTLPNVRLMGKQCPEKIPSNSSGSLRRSRSLRMSQRSRSLERDEIKVSSPEGSVIVSHPVLETGALPSGVCREVIVHLPEQPWTKPFATVKLRPQSTKVEAEGYQTSSGNWSVDSACHSMHSDQVTVLPPGDGSDRQARRSLDKDSAISDVNQSDRLSTSSMHLAQSSCNRLESSCSESSSTRSASRARRKRPSSCVTHVAADDLWPHDDATSLYSLDQDGFYTSMHADSGLSRSNRTLTPGDGVDNLSDHTESISSWDANAKNCEEDEDSKTVIFDDWVPATSATKPSQLDMVTKWKPVSRDGEMGSVLEKEGLISAKDDFQVSQNAERYSEILLKPFESNYNTKSAGFPSFCTITRNSSEADDTSFCGSLKNDAVADSLLATRLSFGSSQDTLGTPEVSVSFEMPKNSGDSVDFCVPSCDRKLEDSSAELIQKLGDPGIEPKQRLMSESPLEDPDGSKVWLTSTVSNTLNSVKGILKSKKKKPFLHSKSINFGPITSLDEILKAKSTPLTIGSSEDVKSVTSYGIPVFSGSSFLGKDVHGENRLKKEHGNKETEAATKSSNSVEGDSVLPVKYKPVIIVKPKQRVKDSDVAIAKGHASNEVMTGYGCLGKDAISSCTGIVNVDGRLASCDMVPVSMKTNLTPVSAKLVITSPVVERTAYIENPHKRSLCTPLTPLDLQQYSGYNDPGSWYNTLPRKSSVRKKIAISISGSDGLTSLIARLPDTDTLRRNTKKTRVARMLPSEQENNSETPSSNEVGNTDCFAMNFANCGTVKRVTTLTRSVTAVPTLPAAQTAIDQNTLLNQRASTFNCQISTLRRSSQNATANSASARANHAPLGRDSLLSHPGEGSFHSRETPANGVSWMSTFPVRKNSNKNNALETCLSDNAVHPRAISISSQTVEQPEAFDTSVVISRLVKHDSKNQTVEQPEVFDSISTMSRHVTQDSENQTVEQAEAFDSISASFRCISGEEGQVFEGEVQNKHCSVLMRTFSSSSSDSSPDVVPSCDGSFTISSTSFARSQESISSILSASEQNHNAKVTFLSSESSDVKNVKAVLETRNPFSKDSAEKQANSCDSNETLESSSRSVQLLSTSVKSSLAQGSANQKQSFESDSSGLGSSIAGSPMTSPDSDIAQLPSSSAFPGLGLSGCVSESSASPDVIPLIARPECSSLAKSKMALTSQNTRSKQTAV